MDTFSPCHDSISEYLSSPYDLKRAYVDNKQCICGKNCTIEDSEVTELGTALSRVVNVGVPLSVHGCNRPSDWNEICHPGTGKLCEEFEIQEEKFSTASTQKVLNKCVSLPISRKPQSCPVSIGGIDHGNDLSYNPVCSRSLSLPTPLKLVSAMKGGREKEGIPPLEKLTVKWAPGVHDPPATSLSHTVKSYNQQQRSSSSSRSNNKKHGKHKHKGKSSRGSNSSDKKQCRKYVCNSDNHNLHPISQVTSDRLQHLDDFEQSSVELVDFGVTGQDSSNCGSSFLKTSLMNMHISIAEAT